MTSRGGAAAVSYAGPVKVYVIHENPDWFGPIAAALATAGVPYEQWLLGEAAVDLAEIGRAHV